ncbi:RHS repeat-associated core domain-containing protein [Pseudomonas phoenicis]|uniref:RHS repeat-associated core domain-containing protein n=1 Tax=unclassified Pseudomonas TaxID=196821 RepID=UPI0039A1F452
MNSNHVFYRHDRMTTIKNDLLDRSIFEHSHALLGEIQTGIKDSINLLTTDYAGSVAVVMSAAADERHSYSPYGNACTLPSSNTLLGYNQEWINSHGSYFLGNYRLYSPTLMRFCSLDTWAPFGKGGINPYSYCAGDPINRSDPTGHMPKSMYARNKKMPHRYRVEMHESGRLKSPLGVFGKKGMGDVMETLIKYLPPQDLTRLSLTSTSMNTLVQATSERLAHTGIQGKNPLLFLGAISDKRLAKRLPGVSRRALNLIIPELPEPSLDDRIRYRVLEDREIEIDSLKKGYHVFSQTTGRRKALRDLRETDGDITLAPWERGFIRRNSI